MPLDELEPVSLPDDGLPALEPEVDDDPVLPDVPLVERPDVDPLELPELPLPMLLPELPVPMLLPELPLPMLLPELPLPMLLPELPLPMLLPELPLPMLLPELPLPMLLPELPLPRLLPELPLPVLLPLRPLQESFVSSPRLTRKRFSTSLTPGMASTISSIMYFE